MLMIRLRRTGKKNIASYRVVVAEKTSAVKGKLIDLVGNYNPHTKAVIFDKEKLMNWLDKGAQASNAVAKLIKKQKITHKNANIVLYPKKAPKKKEEKASASAPTETKPEDSALEEQSGAKSSEAQIKEAESIPDAQKENNQENEPVEGSEENK